MNLRLSMVLVAVLVLLGGTFLVVRFAGSKETPPDEPWLFRIDDDDINHIVAKHRDQTVTYKKNPGSLKWFILEDPELPVNFEKWSGIPLLLSGPRVNRVLSDIIENPGTYGLDPPETSVKITTRSGQGFEFHVGFSTPDKLNTYARLVGFPQLFTVPTSWATVISHLATEPAYPRLYLIEEKDIRDIQVISDGHTVEYHKDQVTGQFTVEGDHEIPVFPEKWDRTLGLIINPRAIEVIFATERDVGAYGLNPPKTVARLINRDGSSIEFHLGITTPDQERHYARTVGREEVMIVPASWAQAVIELATNPPYPQERGASADSG